MERTRAESSKRKPICDFNSRKKTESLLNERKAGKGDHVSPGIGIKRKKLGSPFSTGERGLRGQEADQGDRIGTGNDKIDKQRDLNCYRMEELTLKESPKKPPGRLVRGQLLVYGFLDQENESFLPGTKIILTKDGLWQFREPKQREPQMRIFSSSVLGYFQPSASEESFLSEIEEIVSETSA